MPLEFEYLADRPDLVPLVIDWWHTVWADRMGPDIPTLQEQLRASLSRDQLPIHILATRDGLPVGTAALKLQEAIEVYPDRQYWLGSVFVAEEYRGDNIASAMSQRIVELASGLGLPHLYLQTIDLDGGLYSKLGWEPVERFRFKDEETLLMVRQLK